MVERGVAAGDLAGLVVPLMGQLVATGDQWEPYRLLDGDGVCVEAAGAYFSHLQAAGRSEATVRSYGMDLLRWFRFLQAAGVAWDRASRAGARDSAGGCWSPASRPGRTGVIGIVGGQAQAASLRAGLMRRRCVPTATGAAQLSHFTWSRARGRWSIRSRHHLARQPIRDLLVDYLRERQPTMDYGSLDSWLPAWACSGPTWKPTIPASTACT